MNDKTKKKSKFIRELKSIVWIIFIVLVFRSIFFEPFKIPSGSMIPTLMIGDFILVDKFAYGFKVPFSDMFSGPIYFTKSKEPQRGDVIVFKYPKDTSINYIKRVVGLPGDTLEIINKVVYINDIPVPAISIDGKDILADMDDKFKAYNLKFFKTQTGKAEHITQIDIDNHYNDNYPKITIPPNSYFVLGDNRDFSADSRYWRFVPREYIKGKAIAIWFSMIMPWNDDPMKFRPWRIGKLIR